MHRCHMQASKKGLRAALAALALLAVAMPAFALEGYDADPLGDPIQLSMVDRADHVVGDPLVLAAVDYGQNPPDSSGDIEDYSGYNSSYIFAMTRGVSRSTIVTPLKPPLFIFTIPLDIVFLPFALIGGFF